MGEKGEYNYSKFLHVYTTIRKSKAPKPRQWNLPQEVHTLDQLSQHTIALGQVLCLLMMKEYACSSHSDEVRDCSIDNFDRLGDVCH